ncbi:unnamed protein product [Cylindrotheca closterium]|uniref:Uncharacterized protein n=1 Tax=Cylindrotheca closterium TaxID=2856 RepID=A0AAD2CSE1_9STRA|nr:unnamed protein product [Cylindrotheca closterium]
MPNEVTYFVQITDPDSAYNVGTLSLKESFNFRNLFKGTLRTNNLDIEIAKIGPSLSNLAEWSGYQVVRDGEISQFIKLMSSSSLMFRSVSITGRADKVTDNVYNDVSRRPG